VKSFKVISRLRVHTSYLVSVPRLERCHLLLQHQVPTTRSIELVQHASSLLLECTLRTPTQTAMQKKNENV